MCSLKIFAYLLLNCLVFAESNDRLPLSYRAIPENLYEPPKPVGSISLLEHVNSRSNLNILARILSESAGKSTISKILMPEGHIILT